MIEDRKDPEVHYGQSQVLHWSPRVRTFQGTDPVTDEPVSVKVIGIGSAPEVSGYGRLFLDRCEVLRRLDHPALPHLREAGLTPSGDAYLVFDWIEARRLSDVIPLEPDAALPLIGQVLEGLECLALHNLVHWNVSPETILVQQDGQARLVGLGVSLLPLDWWTSHREPLEVAERYLAPEFRSVVQGPTASFGGAWWKADLYAMAMVTCDALGAPVQGEGTAEPRVEIAEDVPRVVRQTIESCLLEDPQQRPVSFAQVIRVFRDAARVSESGSWLRAAFADDSSGADVETSDGDASEPSEEETASLGSTQVFPHVAAADFSLLQGLIEDRIASGDEVGVEAGEAAELLRDLPELGGVEAEASDEATMTPESAAPPAERAHERADEIAESSEPPEETPAEPAPKLDEAATVVEAVGSPREILSPLPDEDEQVASAAARSEPEAATVDGEVLELEEVVSPDLMETQPLPVFDLGESTTEAPEGPHPAARSDEEKPDRRPPLRWPTPGGAAANRWLAAIATAALLVMAVAALWPDGSERPARVDETSPAPADPSPPAPAPERAVDAEVSGTLAEALDFPTAVDEAYALYAEGDLLAARGRVEAWLEAQERPLTSELCAVVPPLLESIDRARAQEVERSLRLALTRGDGGELRRTLASVEGPERDLLLARAASADVLTRAEEVAGEIARFEREVERGDYLEALERGLELRGRYPSFDRTLRLTERAALGVERTVDNLIGNARYEEAESVLVAMRELLPERGGYASRLTTLERGQQSRERWETLLERAEATLEERPSEGLEMLSGVQVPYELVSRYSELEDRLRQRLARLDAEPPTLVVTPDDWPEIRKGQSVSIEFEASDDYGVETVRVWGRASESSEFEALPVDSIGEGRYRVEIAPAVHGDKPLDLWIEVADVSGHETSAGSAEEPLTLKRRRWFRFG